MGDFFASGGADKQAMIWRAPLEENKGEVIEGLSPGNLNINLTQDNINSPGSEKNNGMDWNQSLYASVFPNESDINNNNMNMSTMQRNNTGNNNNNDSLLRNDSTEENMLIMDKVMTTLDQIVVQIDDMNKGLNNISNRVVNLEHKKGIKDE